MNKLTLLGCCQYLLSSPINYTLTHFADHSKAFSHDMINRYLVGERIAPRFLWRSSIQQKKYPWNYVIL